VRRFRTVIARLPIESPMTGGDRRIPSLLRRLDDVPHEIAKHIPGKFDG
jgi:hypothetical protein